MSEFYPFELSSEASVVHDILEGAQTGFIDQTYGSNLRFRPRLVLNDEQKRTRVLSAVLEELSSCESFEFSVAFITSDGLACLSSTFHELDQKGIHGKILTSTYLDFTDPEALRKILQFKNIDLRVYTKAPFHTKGYLFIHKGYNTILVGSSNLTANALAKNQEWNVRVGALSEGSLAQEMKKTFSLLWEDAETIDDAWLDRYKVRYKERSKSNIVVPDVLPEPEKSFKPNKMQEEALANLAKFRAEGKKRAICIAATGTGKTFLSALDIKQCNPPPKRVLYLCNREEILRKSAESFEYMLGESIHNKIGFLVGGKNIANDYLFASSLTLAQDKVLHSFAPDTFDYIVVDEVHHLGADTYRKIANYFTPKFTLGLTATPERSDGFNIFEFFDYNIASDIRLQDALEANLLCDFHYYGVTDLTIDGEEVSDVTDFSKLVSDARIKHILETVELYKNNSEPIKGLIFCSRTDEASKLSEGLNKAGKRTIALSGNNTAEEREAQVDRLVKGDLDYIITVNVFNEGVDIPEVNQVLLLRPTQSAIVFTQQLGRGLRKHEGKSYLTVIDFIGNYTNNYLIPIALFGDNSGVKDHIRRIMAHKELPGTSTIDFDPIARDKILKSLDRTNFLRLKFLTDEFKRIAYRLGKCPRIMDFVSNDAVDPMLFIEYADSYYAFLLKACAKPDRDKYGKEIIPSLVCEMSRKHLASLAFLSLELAKGIRVHELLMLKLLLEKGEFTREEIIEGLEEEKIPVSQADIDGACRMLQTEFYTSADNKKYGNINYVQQEGSSYRISEEFQDLLKNTRYRQEFLDTLEYAFHSFHTNYNNRVGGFNLVLYQKYTRKDVCKLLNWKSDCSSTIYGYKTERNQGPLVCPIFVTYKKSLDDDASTNYQDNYIDSSLFNWYSRNKRTHESDEVAAILDQSRNHIQIMLFVKKNDDEGRDFYYMGNCKPLYYRDTTMKGNNLSVVNIIFEQIPAVRFDRFSYITGGNLVKVDLKSFTKCN